MGGIKMNQALSGAMSSLEISFLLFVILFHDLPLAPNFLTPYRYNGMTTIL